MRHRNSYQRNAARAISKSADPFERSKTQCKGRSDWCLLPRFGCCGVSSLAEMAIMGRGSSEPKACGGRSETSWQRSVSFAFRSLRRWGLPLAGIRMLRSPE